MLVINEADRFKEASVEQVRNIFDHGGIGLVLIGMPGIEKRLALYPQFYSRIGFVHEFRPLGAPTTERVQGHCKKLKKLVNHLNTIVIVDVLKETSPGYAVMRSLVISGKIETPHNRMEKPPNPAPTECNGSSSD